MESAIGDADSVIVTDPKTKMDVDHLNDLLTQDKTHEEIQRHYTQCAKGGHFDNILVAHKEEYNGPTVATEMMEKLFPTCRDVLVLDLGAAIGIIGNKLAERGFKNIHALDPCEEFNKITRNQGIYQRILEQSIGIGVPVDADDDTYDAIVTVGTFCPGHIPCDSLIEIIRVLKPGGFFINGMREEFLSIVPEYKDRLEPLMNQLVEEGKWKKIVWDKYDNHFNEKDGIVMVFQVC